MAETPISVVLEKPVAGGRSLARVDGRVVLVSGGIPGERVRIVVERTGKGVAFGRVVEIEEASPDRVEPTVDPQCGGLAFAHVAYDRQVQLKRAIVEDALHRTGHLRDIPAIEVVVSPTAEWRLRARLHCEGTRVGFFREGTHTLCDADPSRQLAPGLLETARGVVDALRTELRGSVETVVVSQAIDGAKAVAHLELRRPLPRHGDVWDAGKVAALGVEGVSAALTTSRHPATLAGEPWLRESLQGLGVSAADEGLFLQRHAASFFQGNRALIPTLVERVLGVASDAPAVIDLYAGVGLFGVAAAAAGVPTATCVEGDPVSAEDLVANCSRMDDRTRAIRSDVESYVSREARSLTDACVIVDPPRTGLAPVVTTAIGAARPHRLVYVSCDPATLARDLRALTEAGMHVDAIAMFDMFPVTAHVETVVTLSS
ncbi:MAG TPA: RsmD family RNA methyltransferase [Luteitalea sp.]|nr:RsmD family RNA methyltransferase [Luteitalea sp.]